jgi:parallel beta-helix repeat protein
MKTENVVKKVAFLIAFVLVTSGTAFGAAISPSTSTAEYWAVIVGGNSVYAYQSAEGMYNALNRASENWDAGHIRFLVNENATKANIRDAIQWMANEASTEDTCIFYFAGHGENCRDFNGDEIDGFDELIYTFYNEVILDDELEEWLGEVKAQKKVAILDACYSGGVLTPHQIEDEALDTFDLDGFASDLEKANCLVLASCQANKSSYSADVLNNGVFTYYIVQGLWGAADENDDARISVREIYDYSYTKTVEFQEIVWNQEEEPQQPLLWPEDDTAKNIYLITLKKSVPKEIKVPDDYRTIQEAVEAAMPGDIIEVSTGFYNENVIINKPLAVNAPHQDSVIQAADTSLPCMLITVDNTSISGLSCQKGSYGILLLKSNNCYISDCSCLDNEEFGISLASSENNSLSHNNCSNNGQFGIALDYSKNNSIRNSTCSNNKHSGILLYYSSNNNFYHSTCPSNEYFGIGLNYSDNNSFYHSICSDNGYYGFVLLDYSCNNRISNSICSDNEQYGIALSISDNNSIFNSTCFNNKHSGIILDGYSCNNNITNSICSDNGYYGFVLLDSSCNNRITNSTCINNKLSGIHLDHSGNNSITNSICFNNEESGFFLYYSGSNNLTNSICSNNKYQGIKLDYSDNNSLFNSTCSNNEGDGLFLQYSSNNRISIVNSSNNEGDGLFLQYSSNNRISIVNSSNNEYDGLFLQYSSNNRISIVNSSNNEYYGIELDFSDYNSILKSTCLDNEVGIVLDSSGNNCIISSTCSNNEVGITLNSSTNNTLTGNTANLNEQYHGIQLTASNNNGIVDNNASNNFQFGIALFETSNNNTITDNSANSNDICGISVDYSNNNAIIRNTASNNEQDGIFLNSSNSNTLRNNLMYGNSYNFGIGGDSDSDLNNDIDTSNLVDGKPIYYLVGASGTIINSSSNAGTVHCINCDSITIKDLNLTNNFMGIGFYNTSNSNIQNNNCSSNLIGICLGVSTNNSVTGNTARNNNQSGIGIVNSTSNKIYLNNFINNTDNVYSEDSANIWNSTEEISYPYKGSTYTNYLGNYWDHYTSKDANDDGIWDNPYIIDPDRDYQPLVMPWDNYFAAPKNVLDTGQPANPYPSIRGNHTGTIKTNHTIIATKLYTYHCEGTGGHTEYAKIWNATWDATATWEGYCSDWNNIVFNKPVVLLANETYNYTIRTGSYPQIHHNKILTLPDGEFTCLKFTDANGRVYYDMIPAIRLFQ